MNEICMTSCQLIWTTVPIFYSDTPKRLRLPVYSVRQLADWVLYNHECEAAVLMDLSKAFECLLHVLLFAKLKTYGHSEEAVRLFYRYLSDRSQQIRTGPHTSPWEKIFKNVPLGSILGPLFFNVFINDLFYFIVYSVI